MMSGSGECEPSNKVSATHPVNEEDSTNKTPEKEDADSTNTPAIKSANSWEQADLGDKSRKDKFLKLMGATKAEHKGKIVIGDHAPSHKREDPEKLNQDLEDQFQHSLDHKLQFGYKSHVGLGFTKTEETATTDGSTDKKDISSSENETKTDEAGKIRDTATDQDDSKDKETKVSPEKRVAPTSVDEQASVPKKKSMMMNFVKASNS